MDQVRRKWSSVLKIYFILWNERLLWLLTPTKSKLENQFKVWVFGIVSLWAVVLSFALLGMRWSM